MLPRQLLLISGLITCVMAQVFEHFTTLPDTVIGSVNGIGIGLILIALFTGGNRLRLARVRSK